LTVVPVVPLVAEVAVVEAVDVELSLLDPDWDP